MDQNDAFSGLYGLAEEFAHKNVSLGADPFATTLKDTQLAESFVIDFEISSGANPERSPTTLEFFKVAGGKILELVKIGPDGLSIYSVEDSRVLVTDYWARGQECRFRQFEIETETPDLALLSRHATGMLALKEALPDHLSSGDIGQAVDAAVRGTRPDDIVDISIWADDGFRNVFAEQLEISADLVPGIGDLAEEISNRSALVTKIYTRRAELIGAEALEALSAIEAYTQKMVVA